MSDNIVVYMWYKGTPLKNLNKFGEIRREKIELIRLGSIRNSLLVLNFNLKNFLFNENLSAKGSRYKIFMNTMTGIFLPNYYLTQTTQSFGQIKIISWNKDIWVIWWYFLTFPWLKTNRNKTISVDLFIYFSKFK